MQFRLTPRQERIGGARLTPLDQPAQRERKRTVPIASSVATSPDPVAVPVVIPAPIIEIRLNPTPATASASVTAPTLSLELGPSPATTPTAVPAPIIEIRLNPLPTTATATVPSPAIEIELSPSAVPAPVVVPEAAAATEASPAALPVPVVVPAPVLEVVPGPTPEPEPTPSGGGEIWLRSPRTPRAPVWQRPARPMRLPAVRASTTACATVAALQHPIALRGAPAAAEARVRAHLRLSPRLQSAGFVEATAIASKAGLADERLIIAGHAFIRLPPRLFANSKAEADGAAGSPEIWDEALEHALLGLPVPDRPELVLLSR